jgi:hypothetical protein
MSEQAGTILDRIGNWMADRLHRETSGYEPYTPPDPDVLRTVMKPGDILLVEGNQYISKVIKYLTNSTWSHAAMYVGEIAGRRTARGEPHVLVEVILGEGCISVPLSKYDTYNIRICRPVGLSGPDRLAVVRFMTERIGLKYDMKNIFDMLRYFVPLPLPQRLRRRAIAFGSGDPTRAICSTLIAQAFQTVRYPILPRIERDSRHEPAARRARREIYYIRHHSLFAPRDFDLSPFFAIVKPTLERGFDYKGLTWHQEDAAAGSSPSESDTAVDAANRKTEMKQNQAGR